MGNKHGITWIPTNLKFAVIAAISLTKYLHFLFEKRFIKLSGK